MTQIHLPLVFACLLAACGESGPPTAPTLPPTDPAPSPLALSGVVFEHTPAGSRPLAGFRFLLVWSTALLWDDGAGPTWATTDESGRYLVAAQPGNLVAIDIPAEAGFHAPCPSGFDVLRENATMDVHVVSDAILASTGVPASMPTSSLTVRGTVLEKTSEKARPIGGASVELAAIGSSLRSVTLTDAAGRFLLCANPPGTGTDRSMLLSAEKDGYRAASRSVSISDHALVTVELERN